MSAPPRVEALLPLTPTQTGMWLHSAAGGGEDRFIEQAAFCLEGRVDRDALLRALQCVVDRHGALRSSILAKGLQPLRAVLKEMRVSLREVAAGENEDAALAELMDAERRRGFPLNRPPLIRFALLTVREERAWLVLSFHHIILDGWSLLILWNEAAAFYAAELAGTSVSLPAAADEAAVAEWLRSQSGDASERFWRTRLAGFPAPTPIVTARANTDAEPIEVEHVMSREAGAAIAAAAQTSRVSPAIVCEVLWALLIAGRTGHNDVAFAATVSGRPPGIPGIERMVGCFINTVPIRVQFGEHESVRECLIRHHGQRAEQAEFEFCSAGQIHEWSDLRPGEPMCQSLVVFENLRASSAEHVTAPAVSEAGRRVRGARTGYPLTLLISPGDAPHLRAIFQPESLSESTVRQLLAGLEQLAHRLPRHIDDTTTNWRESVECVPASLSGTAPDARAPFVAPRTRREHELAAIWEDLFKVAPIGVLDDFFSLGGHSLMVLQMATRLRAALGVDVPLHVLAMATTIESLARACASGSSDETTVVPLATGGEGRPIFCPHPLGAHVICYAALGRRLNGRHPVWGIQAKGLVSGERVAASWDEVIEHHWAAITRTREGIVPGAHPFEGVALLGYSYGGYIAMELAARARREGAGDLPVVLLDVPHPSVIPAASLEPDDATLLHALFGHSLQLELEALRQVPAADLTRYVYDAAVARHLIPSDTALEQVERVLSVYKAHSRILPPAVSYDFPVTLVRARDGADRISPLDDLGWSAHTADVTLAWVDGSHETMLDPRYAAVLADLVAASFSR